MDHSGCTVRCRNSDSFSTDLLNLVVPTHQQLIAPDAAASLAGHFTGGFDFEANAYIGFPLLLLLTAFTATHWKDLRVRAAAIVAVAAFLLSLGPHLHIGGTSTGWPLPFWLLAHVPLLQDIQPNRLAVLMWLAIAVLVAVAVDRALTGRFWTQMVPRLGVLGVALVAILPAGLPVSTADVPVFFQRWADHGIPDFATVLIAPFFRDGAGAAPMLWAAVAGGGVRMPEAYAYIPAPDGSPMYGPIGTTLTTTMETIQDTGVVVIVRGPVRDQVARDRPAQERVLIGGRGGAPALRREPSQKKSVPDSRRHSLAEHDLAAAGTPRDRPRSTVQPLAARTRPSRGMGGPVAPKPQTPPPPRQQAVAWAASSAQRRCSGSLG